MPAVNGVGKPCAGEPHARIDGRELETERPGYGHGEEQPGGKPLGPNGSGTYCRDTPPRQLSTLHSSGYEPVKSALCRTLSSHSR